MRRMPENACEIAPAKRLRCRAIDVAALIGFLPIAGMAVLPGASQAAVVPPGVPEPGLVIWGTVVNQNNSQAISITTATWTVNDGSKTAVYSATTQPPTRTVALDGQSYYILQVPFDTRQIGGVTLADPGSVGIDSFELKAASPPTYILVPTINGVLASVRSVDGAPASGGNMPIAGFNAAARGRVIRVDLGIVPQADDYLTWAARFFGNANLPEAARTADPDKDGLLNEAEREAGTDPKDSTSSLRILALEFQDQTGQVVIGWQSVSSHNYLVEGANDPAGPWASLGGQVSSGGTTTLVNLDFKPVDLRRFFRVRLAP